MPLSLFFRLSNISRHLRVYSWNKNHYIYSATRSFGTSNLSANKNIVHSSLDEIKFPETTITEYVFKNFGKFPNKIAVECSATGKKYTYEELRKKSKNFGKALRKIFKLNKGDVIALMTPNIPDFPVCLLGALEAGLVVTTVNISYTPDEVKNQLADSGSKLVITVVQLWPFVQAAINKLPTTIPTVAIKMLPSDAMPIDTINFQDCVDTEYDLNEVLDIDFNDTAMLIYSSGTSGLPKGVELNTKNIVFNLEQFGNPQITLMNRTTDTHQDVIPGILPWFHIYGMASILLSSLANLSKLVSLPHFSPNTYVNMLINHKPSVLYVVPPIVLLMNNSPLVKQEHLQPINTICSGAAPLGALEEDKLRKKSGKNINVVQGYGLTETSGSIALLSPIKKKQLNITGSVGELLGNTSAKIVPVDNSSGEALGPNQCGELLLNGPSITKAYFNKPQETKNAFVNGWFRTGDVGYYDCNHCFYITDRLKEFIKVKGYQVAPAELEETLRNFPGVADSAVIGISHKKYGEVPRGYIVQKKGANINITKLQEYMANSVADFKQLKGGIVIIDAIPKNASGKILRKDLKLLYDKEIKRSI